MEVVGKKISITSFFYMNIDKNYFIKVCEESQTMSEAAKTLNIHFNTLKTWAKRFNCYFPNRGGRGLNKRNKQDTLSQVLSGKLPNYQTYKLKQLLLKNGLKENKCECCGISEWNGKSINMELHHKDGNRFNHKLENLIMLCPNCHSQTDNFRAKNITK
jgi:transposase